MIRLTRHYGNKIAIPRNKKKRPESASVAPLAVSHRIVKHFSSERGNNRTRMSSPTAYVYRSLDFTSQNSIRGKYLHL